jgi:hypothetical protein
VSGEVAAGDELHREEVLPLVFADLVDRDDVGMIEVGCDLRLGPEALHLHRRRELSRQDHLHRDDSIETDLARPVDDAHPAARDLLLQFVIAESPWVGLLRRLDCGSLAGRARG